MDFRNTKIRINSPEHSRAFQEAVFAEGGRWPSSGSEVMYTDEPFLLVNKHNEMRCSECELNFRSSSYREVVLPEPQQAHPHAELMAQYAEDAKTNAKPWELWQESLIEDSIWDSCCDHPSWRRDMEYRRKPKTKLIHGVEVPDISFVPLKTGDYYYHPNPASIYLAGKAVYTDGNAGDKHMLKNGMTYPDTEEGKQAAILHAKAMLGAL